MLSVSFYPLIRLSGIFYSDCQSQIFFDLYVGYATLNRRRAPSIRTRLLAGYVSFVTLIRLLSQFHSEYITLSD